MRHLPLPPFTDRPSHTPSRANQPTCRRPTFYQGQNKDIATWFDESWTTGLVVSAQSAAYPDYERDGTDKSHEAIAVFRTIAAQAAWT